MSDLAHTFNWHEQPPDGFLRWVGLHTADSAWNGDAYEKITAASDGFRALRFTIQVNGIDVDAAWFFSELEKAVDDSIEAGVQDRIEKSAALTEIHNLAADLTARFQEHVYRVAHEAGIKFPNED